MITFLQSNYKSCGTRTSVEWTSRIPYQASKGNDPQDQSSMSADTRTPRSPSNLLRQLQEGLPQTSNHVSYRALSSMTTLKNAHSKHRVSSNPNHNNTGSEDLTSADYVIEIHPFLRIPPGVLEELGITFWNTLITHSISPPSLVFVPSTSQHENNNHPRITKTVVTPIPTERGHTSQITYIKILLLNK